MAIDNQFLSELAAIIGRTGQKITETVAFINLLHNGYVVKTQTGNFELSLTQAQKDQLRTELTAIANELQTISNKILAGVTP